VRGSKFIGITLILASIIIGTSLFLYNRFNEPIEAGGDNEKELTEEQQFSQKLDEAGLFEKIGRSLYKKGYTFGLEYDVLSDKSVEIVIKLPSKKINEENKKEVMQIAKDIIEANNFDLDLFTIKVEN
jgi:preprotein translocase subunit SecF